MTRRITSDLLNLAKEHIILNKRMKMTKDYVKYANCYTYALNIDLPMFINIGDISN